MGSYFLMAFVVAFNIGGHVFLKAGMNQLGAVGLTSLLAQFTRIFGNVAVLVGLLCYVTSVAGYMVLLSRSDISVAYPIVTSLAYGGIILISLLIFREPFSTLKWIGLGLILVGVILVGVKQSPNQ